MARPIEFTPERIKEINALMEEYTDKTYIPKVAEFAYIHNIRRQALYEHEGLSDNLKRMMEKKEANLENDGLDKGKFTPMHAFSLKQLGWKDKHEESDSRISTEQLASILKQAYSQTD